jgi:hypothetical protein
MSSLTLNVQHPSGRLVVRLYLGPGKVYRATLTNSGQQVPVPIQVEALVDTGASRTVVEGGRLVSLRLNPTG